MKRLALAVFISVWAMALGTMPLHAQLRLPPYTRFELPNGLTVLLMEQHETPLVSFNVLVKAGATADPAGKEGAGALTALLLRKGTQSRTADQIATELDFTGGQFDMAGAIDFSSGGGEFLSKDASKGLDLISDMLMNPTFPASEARKLATQQIDGIKGAKDQIGRAHV